MSVLNANQGVNDQLIKKNWSKTVKDINRNDTNFLKKNNNRKSSLTSEMDR